MFFFSRCPSNLYISSKLFKKFSVHNIPAPNKNVPKARKAVGLPYIYEKYLKGIPITMLTAQDYSSASICDKASIDTILVGDSLAMTVLGHPNTLTITMNEMIHHARAVKRGSNHSFLIGDMPFGTYFNEEDGLKNAARFIQESEMNAVKLEGGKSVAHIVKRLTKVGIPVVGHIGLTPQHINILGGFKVFGAKESQEGIELWEDAKALREAGASMIVLECVPERLATLITNHIGVPTIGIGSGSGCSGQVLVFNDLLGIYDKFSPKFCKRFVNLNGVMVEACEGYRHEVETRLFPESKTHTFLIKEEIYKKVEEDIQQDKSLANTVINKPVLKKFDIPPIKNIVVLGTGAIGSLIASKLQKHSGRNVLLFETRQEKSTDLIKIESQTMTKGGTSDNKEIQQLKVFSQNQVVNEWNNTIDLLLVCCKNYTNEADISKFLQNLAPNTKINCVLTLQNGIGNAETLTKIFHSHGFLSHIFPMSIYSGVKVEKSSKGYRQITQSISNKVFFALPFSLENSEVEKLFDIPDLILKNYIKSTDFSENDFVDWQKLLVNAVINPLTMIFEVQNGEIANNPHINSLAKSLVNECVQILKMIPNALEWTQKEKQNIEEFAFSKVMEVAIATASNTSSMLTDLKANRENTEIDSMNGGFVKLAQQYKMHENSYKLNKLIVDLVKGKTHKSNFNKSV